MYGIEMRNNEGKSIIGAGEVCLFYLGKRVINHTRGVDSYVYMKNTMVGGNKFYRCFFTSETTNENIVNSGPGGVSFSTSQLTKKTYFYIGKECPTSVYTVYVFGTLDEVPAQSYGVNIFDTDGRLQFTASRPLFIAKDLKQFYIRDKYPAKGGVYEPVYTPDFSTTFKPAVQTSMTLFYTDRSSRVGVFGSITAFKKNSGWFVGLSLIKYGGKTSMFLEPPDINVTIPVIDASFYDQFSNLPNIFE